MTSVGEDGGKQEPSHTAETVQQVLRRVNIELPHDPAILLVGVQTQEKWKHVPKQNLAQECLCSILHNSQTWKQPKCPLSDVLITETWYMYIVVCYRAAKRSQVLMHPIIGMNLENIMLRRRSQAQRTEHDMIPSLYNVQNRQTCKGRRQVAAAYGWGGEEQPGGE